MIRLLLDQGLPRRTAADLRDFGWDATHVGDLGMAEATDEEIVNAALRLQRVVVTLDSDFAKIHARLGSTQPSVVYIRIERLDRMAATRLLKSIVPSMIADLERGVIASVTASEIRIRDLPLS